MIDQPISQYMNRNVLHGEPDTPLREVVRQLHDHAQSAFVVCDDGAPIGIISERDTVTMLHSMFTNQFLADARAGDVRISPVSTLKENECMEAAISKSRSWGERPSC